MTTKNLSVTTWDICATIVGVLTVLTGPMYGIILWDLWFDTDHRLTNTIRRTHPSLRTAELKSDLSVKIGLTALSVTGAAIVSLIIALVVWGPLWIIIAVVCIHILFLAGFFTLFFILLPEPRLHTQESAPTPPSPPAAPAVALEERQA